MQVPPLIAPYQTAVRSMDVLPKLTKDQHILLLKTWQPVQARTHIFEGEICTRMILTRVKTVHKFAEDTKATRIKDERRQSET